MVEKADLDPKLRQEVDFAKDDELDALGAKIVGKIHLHDAFDAVNTAAQRKDAPEGSSRRSSLSTSPATR